jgi:predicted O-linked N-acetylglucosamine transferase (SPINDLY family)
MLADLKRHVEAVNSYGQALALEPRFVAALQNRAIALRAMRRFEEALADCDRALAIDPKFATVHSERGRLLAELGRVEEGLTAYDRSLALDPRSAAALYDRGLALLELERFEAALASFDKALDIDPNFIAALTNRGNVLLQLGRAEEALSALARVLELAPDSSAALNSYGNVLLDLGRLEEAIASFDRAAQIDPDFEPTWINRSSAALKARSFDIAAESLQRLTDMQSTVPYFLGSLLSVRMQCCDWRSFEELKSRIREGVMAEKRVAEPFHFLLVSDSSADELRAARIFVRDRLQVSSEPAHRSHRRQRLRIAYVSSDFHAHAVTYLISELIERHDRTRFEIIGVSFGPDDGSAMRARVVRAFDQFIDVRGRNDREIAALIKDMEIDIAIDLKGFTENAKTSVFALRPAPIQVNYLGYPGTMGAEFIDYIIADQWVIPTSQQKEYCERVVYLPDCNQANDSRKEIASRMWTRKEAGLPESGFVFCCFNHSYKVTPLIFNVWMRLLQAVEGSVLWLVEGNAAVPGNLRREAEAHSVDPQRLIFAPRVAPEEHLSRHRLADLFLDTLPYNAHTTGSDALRVGLPLLTCLGTTFASRVAASLLHAIGLPELVTRSLAEYEALALKLARNPDLLAAIKDKLARNRETFPLFDTVRFTRHIEAAYTSMWDRYQRGEPPEGFSVDSSDRARSGE